MSATESIRCELIDASILLQSSAGELADEQAALFGVPPESVLFEPVKPQLEAADGWDERAADAWTSFHLESCEL